MIQIPTPIELNTSPLPRDWEHNARETVEGASVECRRGYLVVSLTSEKPSRVGPVSAPIRIHRITPN